MAKKSAKTSTKRTASGGSSSTASAAKGKKKTTGTKAAASGTTSKKTSTRKKTQTRASSSTKTEKPAAAAPSKPPAAPDPLSNGDRPTDEQLRKVKTGLTKRDIERFKKMLLEKRAELIGDVESLQQDAQGGGDGISYEHMADVGTDSYEQEFTLGLVESERQILREIDEALGRIENGTYGVCIESAQPIGKPRLEAKPWAKHCIEVAREREKRGLD